LTGPYFGAILAGGRNSRYGEHKALATVAGVPIITRIQRVLGGVTPDLILIANEPERYEATGLRQRPDAIPALGALGGIYSALLWALEEGRRGVLAVACDMPFLDGRLLGRLLAGAGSGAEIVVPESPGRRGVEPLCAFYATSCIPAIESQIARGDRQVIGFYDGLRVERIPLAEVRAHGDPELLFMNVNTPEERERAEQLAREQFAGEQFVGGIISRGGGRPDE
jgi:molybdopterin-guanine dinucleotide biosynthesis protein A